jgi:hypothetical protein
MEACQVLGTIAAVIPHAREQTHADDRVSYRLFDDLNHAASEADVLVTSKQIPIYFERIRRRLCMIGR